MTNIGEHITLSGDSIEREQVVVAEYRYHNAITGVGPWLSELSDGRTVETRTLLRKQREAKERTRAVSASNIAFWHWMYHHDFN